MNRPPVSFVPLRSMRYVLRAARFACLFLAMSAAFAQPPQLLFDYQLANGSEHRAQQRRSTLPAVVVHRELARQLGRQPVVQTRSADGWLLTSYVQNGQLHLVQVRDDKSGSLLIESRFTPPRPGPARRALPHWWPPLINSWHGHTNTAGVRTTSIVGWLPGSIDAAQRVFLASASRAGFEVSTRVPVTATSPGYGSGVMLILHGRAGELLLTLSNGGGRTGVVAHLKRTPE